VIGLLRGRVVDVFPYSHFFGKEAWTVVVDQGTTGWDVVLVDPWDVEVGSEIEVWTAGLADVRGRVALAGFKTAAGKRFWISLLRGFGLVGCLTLYRIGPEEVIARIEARDRAWFKAHVKWLPDKSLEKALSKLARIRKEVCGA